jgi:RNA polymerase sigma-70 factor (ECF subfamily)
MAATLSFRPAGVFVGGFSPMCRAIAGTGAEQGGGLAGPDRPQRIPAMWNDSGPVTCWHLVERAAAGEPGARSTFCRTYLPLLRSYLASRWRRSPFLRELDDAVQEAFVECLRPGGPLARADARRGDLRGFLFGVGRNVARRFEERARSAHAPRLASGLGEVAGDDTRLSQLFDREWARTLMREARDLMQARADSPEARQRVELLRRRFGQNLPIRAIAAEWGMDPALVHRAYARAREEFHACLREVVRFHAVRTESDLDAECRRLFQVL